MCAETCFVSRGHYFVKGRENADSCSTQYIRVARCSPLLHHRWPHLQTNAPKLPLLHCPQSLILPQGSDVRSVLQDGHVILSIHAGWGGAGRIDLPDPLQSVCQRHAFTLVPLRGRHGHHNHVPQAPRGGPLPAPMSGGYMCYNPSFLRLAMVPSGSK